MSNPIYPAIVPGLKVRHRETLEERTVTSIDKHWIDFADGGNIFRVYFWDHYEPLPQPGDRVRVVRTDSKTCDRFSDCIGMDGLLRGPTKEGEYCFFGTPGHFCPLSDFEVIPPEANVSETEPADIPPHESSVETNMTDNETEPEVLVPVIMLERWKHMLDKAGYDTVIGDYIPKPKPRLVAVDLDRLEGMTRNQVVAFVKGRSDLLETLDGVIDAIPRPNGPDELKAAIRKALGVTDE